MRRIISIAAILFFCTTAAKATHIVGGEIYYDCLGNNNYRITLKVYRDCLNGQAPYDNPASVGIFDVNGNLVDTLEMFFPGSVQLPPSINSPCYSPPNNNVCVEEADYVEIKHIVPLPGGLTLAYQRCCRNGTILNLINPLNVGSTYTAEIPDPSLAICNSSPRYNNFPPIYICQNAPLWFDHSATDPDGDSLVYMLCDPYDGASSANPQPQPPAGPPYAPVPWAAPYSGTYPMSSAPPVTINSQTGALTGTPNMVGQWVVGVCCYEYRNGHLLSITKRDFQFNVLPCPMLTISSIPSQTTFCGGFTVNFQNSSINATTYHWDFGDPTTQADTSNQFTPSYTYGDTGVYHVVLICDPNSPCSDTDTTTFRIYPPVVASFVPPAGQCITGNSFNFTAGGQFMNNATFTWNFGANATPQTSTLQNPSNVVFNTPGTFAVTLTIDDNGCTATYTDSVVIYALPVLHFHPPPLDGCVPFTVQFGDDSLTGIPNLSYVWYFGDGDTSHAAMPTHTYTNTGSYNVTLVVTTTAGCIVTQTFNLPNMINVHPLPVAGLSVNPTAVPIANALVVVTDQSSGADSCLIDFGDGITTNICDGNHVYWNYGNYTITQIVWNQWGCSDTADVSVEVIPENHFYIPNTFTPNGDGLNDIFLPAIMGVENYHFMIFDRWGNLFFETNDIYTGWDGRYKGNKCQEDVYVWKIDYTDVTDGQPHRLIGHVNLIR